MDDLVTFLRARLDEDEQWALAVSRPYRYAAPGARAPETGVHWEWVTGDDWEPVKPDPVVDEYVAGSDPVWLATKEKWQSKTSPGDPRWALRRTYSESAQEMDSAAAGHIARHDPARVLREVEAKRGRLDRHQPREAIHSAGPDKPEGRLVCRWCDASDDGWYATIEWPCPDLRDDATVYVEHPDYRTEWAPDV